ncbi:MAG: protein kinase [Chloroflexota bacterium]
MVTVHDVIEERYRIDSFLKSGSGTDLWSAHDMRLRREILVRIVKDNMLGNSHYISRFAYDAQILAQLEHPHIVPIHDYGIHGDNPYQIQRYIGVSTLEDFVNGFTKFETLEQLRLLQQIASAIDYIHERGIVHRDLHAHNIILDNRNTPYLSNFSLAAFTQSKNMLLDEPATTKRANPNEYQKDIFTFGSLAHIVLTHGEPPRYYGQELTSKIQKYRPDLPTTIELVIKRLISEDSSQQYTTASNAVDDLFDAYYSGNSRIDGTIFVSYASVNKHYVQKLVEEMRSIGLDIWIDGDIPTGTTWADGIQNALNECDIMLLIVTENSMDSDYVTHEWSYFMGSGKPVYPFVLGGELPKNIHPRLEHFQFSFGTDDMLGNVSRIIDMLSSKRSTE